MIQIVAAILAGLGLFLLLRSLWIRTGLTLRQTALTLAAAGVVLALIVLAATGRLNWLVAAAAALLPFVNRLGPLLKIGALFHRLFPGWHRHLRAGLGGGATAAGAAKAGDGVSRTETAWLRMTLDHANGRMDGEVLAGRYRGRFLSELGMAELLGLLADCDDFDSSRLLESFLDRVHPEWRQADSERTQTSAGASMTRAEALEILGLAEGAGEADIVAAHRRLMQRLHPDRGGSTFLAAQINAARQVLLS